MAKTVTAPAIPPEAAALGRGTSSSRPACFVGIDGPITRSYGVRRMLCPSCGHPWAGHYDESGNHRACIVLHDTGAVDRDGMAVWGPCTCREERP